MSNPDEIRARIEECRQELARAEGEKEALGGEVGDALVKLRELLGCKPGKEKASLKKLKQKIADDEAEVEQLLEQAEAICDGEEDEDGDD